MDLQTSAVIAPVRYLASNAIYISALRKVLVAARERLNSPLRAWRESARFLKQLFGARCSMIAIVRNQTAAIATRIYEPFVLCIS